MDIRKNTDTCRFTEQLLIHIGIRGISGCLSFLQSLRCWARILQCHKPYKLKPTVGMSVRSSWLLARLWGLRQWCRYQRFWLWSMVAQCLALLRWHDSVIVYNGIFIIGQSVYHLCLPNRPRLFAIILILILLHLILPLIFLLFIFLLLIIAVLFHI